MVDANQGWTVKKSIAIAPRLLDLGVRRLEEPVPRGIDGQAEIRRAPRSRSWRANPHARRDVRAAAERCVTC
jgi:L-alanine-DL-glutamate epimerase-like enolase superfamily enzyme